MKCEIILVLVLVVIGCCQAALMRRENSSHIRKNLNPELVNGTSEEELEQNKETVCWNVILERSAVAFALQNRVLNELQVELLDSATSDRSRQKVNQLAETMRRDMNEALRALKARSAEHYFGALFRLSDDIVQFSTLMRDPDPDDRETLPILAKAVARLGRHNSNLVEEITERCSLLKKSPIY